MYNLLCKLNSYRDSTQIGTYSGLICTQHCRHWWVYSIIWRNNYSRATPILINIINESSTISASISDQIIPDVQYVMCYWIHLPQDTDGTVTFLKLGWRWIPRINIFYTFCSHLCAPSKNFLVSHFSWNYSRLNTLKP